MEMKGNEKSVMLAKRIELLFGFCAQMIPDIDLLKDAMAGANEKENFAMSAAPVLMAQGVDPFEKESAWQLKRKRAEALINLLEVLKETEEKRVEETKKQASMNEVVKMFGL